MFGLIGSSKRDEYGVGDLLAEVSKRSASISTEDRQEIADISKRLKGANLNLFGSSTGSKLSQHTPDNSQHGGNSTASAPSPSRKDFGKDILKVGLLRGFGAPPVEHVPPTHPSRETLQSLTTVSQAAPPRGILLRGFGPTSQNVMAPAAQEESESSDEASQ